MIAPTSCSHLASSTWQDPLGAPMTDPKQACQVCGSSEKSRELLLSPHTYFQGEGEELSEGRSFLGEFLGLILILCQWFTFLCVVKLEDWAGSYQNVYRKNVSSLLRPQGLVNCESLTGKWVLGSWLWVLWQSYIEGKKWAFKESRSLLSWSQLEFKLPLAGREPLRWQPEPGLWWWVIQVWVTAPELVH